MCGEFSNIGGTSELISMAMGISSNSTINIGEETCNSSFFYDVKRSWPEYATSLHTAVQKGTRSSRIAMCNHSGYYFLTSRFEQSRRLVFYTLLIMVVQLWQVYLYQFPHWNLALKKAHPVKRVALQASVMILFIISMICAYLVFCCDIKASHVEELVCLVLLGWTLWLFFFVPVLADTHGEKWLQRLSQESIQQFASYIRISHTCLLALMFFVLCWRSGLLQARMDLTFITIMVPTLYCSVFLLASMYMNANALLVGIGAPFALLAALIITIHLAKAGGDGGFLLVFFHIMLKWTEFFGGTEDEEDAEESESITPTSSLPRSSQSSRDRLLDRQNGDLKNDGSTKHLEVARGGIRASTECAPLLTTGSPQEPSPAIERYRFYSMDADYKRNDLTATAPAEHLFTLVDTQVPSVEKKADGGAAVGAGLEDTSFMVGLVETDSDFLNEFAKKEAGLSDIDHWHHVPSRSPSAAGSPQQSYLEEKFRKGSFRTSTQWRRRRASSVDSVVGGSSTEDKGLVSSWPSEKEDKREGDEKEHSSIGEMRGNRSRAGSSLDDSDIPVYVSPRSEVSSHYILRATKSADYLLPEEEEDGGPEGGSPGLGGLMKDTSYAALRLLERRGEEDSALVKIDLPTSLKKQLDAQNTEEEPYLRWRHRKKNVHN